jgi:hypothetical protein
MSSQLHALAALPPGERALGTHWVGGWVGSWTGLDDVERIKILPLPGLGLRPLGRPARSQSLYRLRCPRSKTLCIHAETKHARKYSGTSVVERLSSRANRFPNIKQKQKQKTHRFPNRQTGNQVREMYGGRASVTSQPPLSAASCSNLLCLFLILFVFCCFFINYY